MKKKPNHDLENYRKIFLQLGLVLALSIVYITINHKTYERSIKELTGDFVINDEQDEEIIFKMEQPKIEPKPTPKTPDIIKVIDDEEEIIENIIESTETNEDEIIELTDIIEIDEEEDIIENVPFTIIEEVPVYPGCDKKDKTYKRECFQQKITKHIRRKFNSSLAGDLGLSPGRKSIRVMFKINENGDVVDIQARGPHKRLVQEAKRVISLLPKMKPGKQRGRSVSVSYSLPINFMVE